MKAVSAARPQVAATVRLEGSGRLVRAFALDLAVSLVLVLVVVRFSGIVARTAPPADWGYDAQVAVERFTPAALWDSYAEQVRSAVAETVSHPGPAFMHNMLLGGQLVIDVVLAVPDTLAAIWQRTETTSDWIALIGFSAILVGTFVVLVANGRMSLLRLILALVGSPPAAITLFWIGQQTVQDALGGFACYAAAAPWCLLCPIACTAYWVAFPGAEHSATVTGLRLIGRLRTGWGRGRGIADGVSTTPLTRKRK